MAQEQMLRMDDGTVKLQDQVAGQAGGGPGQ